MTFRESNQLLNSNFFKYVLDTLFSFGRTFICRKNGKNKLARNKKKDREKSQIVRSKPYSWLECLFLIKRFSLIL